jgi:hypothetical protein
MPKQSDDLSRECEPSQETEKAKLKIPVPKRKDFGRFIEGIKRQKQESPSRSDSEKR